MLEHTYGVRIAASAEAGRKLVAAESYAAGDQIIQELPLALSMAPSAHVHLCMVCCNPLDVPASSTPPRDGGDLSGFSQHTCSAKCAATATEQGFNDWWKAVGPLYQYAVQQHPAAARHMLAVAGMLARSWVSDPDTYWAHVEQLCAATGKDVWSAADRDAHATEYALLRQGFAAALVAKGGKAEEVDGVFESTYNLEWYAAMRGLLRLNALSVPLQALSTPPPAIPPLAHIKPASLPASAAKALAQEAAAADDNVAFVGGVPQAEVGAAPLRGKALVGGAGAAGEGGETPVATGVFLACSLLNHSCAPNATLSFTLGPTAVVTAAQDIAEGEEVTLNYTQSQQLPPPHVRAATLANEYGFWCNASPCGEPGCAGAAGR